MRLTARSTVAIGLVVLLGAGVFASRWYERQRSAPRTRADSTVVTVSNGADRGPGTLREALFIAAAAAGPATISIRVPKITLETPLPPLVSTHGLSLTSHPAGAQIDAHLLRTGPVFDIGAPDASIAYLHVTGCPGAAVLLRATHFRLQSTTIEGCDVGVEVADNASAIELTHNQFVHNRLAIRFAAAGEHDDVVQNLFSEQHDAGLWAVGGEATSHGDPIHVHDNHFDGERNGIVAGNVPILVDHNEFTNSHEAAIHLVGAAAAIRNNRISGGESMGIVAENARGAIVDGNEIDTLAAYGIMVRGSSNTLVRNNRLHGCGYGLAFVLGDSKSPSTAVDNMIIEPKFDGIDVVGDSPILRHNQVLRPHALALRVDGFQPAGGARIQAHPFLDNNSFGTAAESAGT
jgi:parallel beta-helix repeat protein